jgi:hypothetical protein
VAVVKYRTALLAELIGALGTDGQAPFRDGDLNILGIHPRKLGLQHVPPVRQTFFDVDTVRRRNFVRQGESRLRPVGQSGPCAPVGKPLSRDAHIQLLLLPRFQRSPARAR